MNNITAKQIKEKEITWPVPHKMYEAITLKFRELMIKELAANTRKGDREGREDTDGWLGYDDKFWLGELYYHVGKLQHAVMNNDEERIKENTADLANIAMMMLDNHVQLLPVPYLSRFDADKSSEEYAKRMAESHFGFNGSGWQFDLVKRLYKQLYNAKADAPDGTMFCPSCKGEGHTVNWSHAPASHQDCPECKGEGIVPAPVSGEQEEGKGEEQYHSTTVDRLRNDLKDKIEKLSKANAEITRLTAALSEAEKKIAELTEATKPKKNLEYLREQVKDYRPGGMPPTKK